VYGSEPSSTRPYLSFYHGTKAIDTSMASSAAEESKDSSQSTVSGSSSSPPIPIKPRKNSSLPTPNPSHETDRKDNAMIHEPGGHNFGGGLPLTPGDLLPEMAQRRSNPALGTKTRRLLASLGEGHPRSRLKRLDKEKLLELRASSRHSLEIDFPVDKILLREWEERFPDLGGYEYIAREEKLIIHTLPGPVHEAIVELFHRWFDKLEGNFPEDHVKLRLRTNQS
jgi:hypothetical protein